MCCCSGHVVIETKFFDKDLLVSTSRVRIFYVWHHNWPLFTIDTTNCTATTNSWLCYIWPLYCLSVNNWDVNFWLANCFYSVQFKFVHIACSRFIRMHVVTQFQPSNPIGVLFWRTVVDFASLYLGLVLGLKTWHTLVGYITDVMLCVH